MNDVLIRRMHFSDAGAVHAIEADTFPRPWSQADFEKEMTQNACARYLVAETEGKIVGFAGAWLILDEGHITNIAVQKEYRGRGIGERLTAALMQYAANLGVVYMTLEVRRGNLIAQSLYKKLNFEYVGVRKRYYEDNGEDAFLFCCQHMPKMEPDFEEEETIREE